MKNVDLVRCSVCDSTIATDALRCPSCGAATPASRSRAARSRVLAWLALLVLVAGGAAAAKVAMDRELHGAARP